MQCNKENMLVKEYNIVDIVKTISELWNITCDMRSHNFSCYLSQINVPCPTIKRPKLM